jgi:hypothetical protein
VRRLLLVLLAAACAGCASAGGATPASSPAPGGRTAAAAARQSGAVTASGGRVYVVARRGRTLRLDDVAVRVLRLAWRRHVTVSVVPPGTRIYAEARLRLTNLSARPQSVLPTQIWAVDDAGDTYLAADATVRPRLLRRILAPGQSAVGTLVFPLPDRAAASSLLVYRFADARRIAHARRIGLLRLGG